MSTLYCIAFVPIPDKKPTEKDLQFMANGPGNDPKRQLLWVARAVTGLGDHRQEHFCTHRQKLVVFPSKKSATDYAAKRHGKNRYWKTVVREVRLWSVL